MKNIYILLKLLTLIFIINKISLVYTKEALAELWDVEDSDLLHYLGIENNLVAVDTALREVLRGFSSSFGGTYLDVRNNTVYCNIVDETKRLSQLIRLYEPLDIHIYIDHKLNNVVLLHDPEDDKENKDFLERANKFNPSLIAPNVTHPNPRYNNSSQAPTSKRVIVDRIFGGDGAINYDTGSICSLGFWAKHVEDEENYLVTAGHCYNSSVGGSQEFFHLPWDSEDPGLYLGSMESFEVIKEYDFGLIDITGKNIGQSAIINNIDSESFRELHILEYGTIFTHGAHLCKSGLTTHVTCGFVRGLKSIATSTGEILEDLIYYGKDTFQTSCGGDSGGPVFSYLNNLSTVSLHGISILTFFDFSESMPLYKILGAAELNPVIPHQ
ncbi:protease [Gigaspora margarita]|uniref:Protease n=1 Tax=Gigaspora margarita TaxID=4874 RepID=A0A8H4ANA5_GIGMA|nr:protease [Gigaspora margarita]